MFSPQLPEPARLDVTLARIRAIVGEENVGRAALKDTHEPDGFRLEPFGLPSWQSSQISPVQSRAAVRQLRPAEAVSITLQSKCPRAFVFREQHYAVERAYGPWLAGGEWWNPTLWGWEEWDLVTRDQDGTLLCCCLVRDLMRDMWQMVALYD
jgi:protein ImuB